MMLESTVALSRTLKVVIWVILFDFDSNYYVSLGKIETKCQLKVLPKMTQHQRKISAKMPDSPVSPPAIVEHLKSVEAEDGSEVELACKIVCPSSFDVVWIHNGKEIKPSKDFQYHHVDSRYSLKIPELFPEDSGIYTCEAFNDFGESFTTCSLFVACPGLPATSGSTAFNIFPKSVSVNHGAPVVVQAELASGCDQQVTWIKDGCVVDQKSVNDQGKVQFSVVEASLKDAGMYELHVKKMAVDANDKTDEYVAAFAVNVL